MAKGTLRVNGVLVASEIHKIVQESGTGSGGGTGVGDEILLETGFHILTEVSATAAIQAQTGDNIVIREDDGTAVLTVDTSGVATFTGNVNVGTDDVGHDVKFHGATAGSYMLWDESTDDLIVGGAGQIGIGSTAPSDKLDVNGGSIRLDNTYGLRWGADKAGIYGNGETSGGFMRFVVDDVERIRIIEDGKVGIGTTAPSSALHISAADVASSGTSNAQLHIRDTAAFSAAQNAGIAFEAEWQNGSFTQIAAINASRDSTSTGQYGGHLKFNIRTHGANVSEAMRITSAGKVGIGTSAPNTHLEVSDGVPTFRLNSTEGNVGNTDILGEISWKSADSNRTGDPIAYIRAVSENATGSATALTFGTGFDSNNASERMRIKNSGNVGIGTTAPDTKLHIQHTYDGGGDGFVHFQSDGTECGVTWERTESTARKIKWGLGADGKFNVYDETNTILCFYIATNGVIHGDFNDTSDESLKKNIQSLDSGALSKINSLRPVSFDWKEKGKGSSVGFIAQEVEKIFPSEVIGEEYVEDQVTEATYYTNSDVLPEGKKVGDIKTEAFTTAGNLGKAINTSGIVAHLTKAVQELSAKVKVLEDA